MSPALRLMSVSRGKILRDICDPVSWIEPRADFFQSLTFAAKPKSTDFVSSNPSE
jgi:hypothetical protein